MGVSVIQHVHRYVEQILILIYVLYLDVIPAYCIMYGRVHHTKYYSEEWEWVE